MFPSRLCLGNERNPTPRFSPFPMLHATLGTVTLRRFHTPTPTRRLPPQVRYDWTRHWHPGPGRPTEPQVRYDWSPIGYLTIPGSIHNCSLKSPNPSRIQTPRVWRTTPRGLRPQNGQSSAPGNSRGTAGLLRAAKGVENLNTLREDRFVE